MVRSLQFRRAFGCVLYGVVALFLLEMVAALLSGRAFLWADCALIALIVPLTVLAANDLLFPALDGAAARVRLARKSLVFLFALYVALLLYVLYLSRSARFFSDRTAYLESGALNLIPLQTVRRYIRALRRGIIPRIALTNLVGNLVLFAPCGMLLPLLFPALRRFWRFLLIMLGVSVAAEAMQFVLRCGSCDVDDALLNLVGAVAAYWVLRVPVIERHLKARYYLATETDVSETVLVPPDEL